MTLSFSKFEAWQKESSKAREVLQWLNHIGQTGRSTRSSADVLNLSPGHCKAPQFTIAGQYTEGGNNYWESPDAFNDAMQAVILSRFKELSGEAVALIEKRVAEALVSAADEVAAVQAAVTDAKMAVSS